jgi:hypothetical protein
MTTYNSRADLRSVLSELFAGASSSGAKGRNDYQAQKLNPFLQHPEAQVRAAAQTCFVLYKAVKAGSLSLSKAKNIAQDLLNEIGNNKPEITSRSNGRGVQPGRK